MASPELLAGLLLVLLVALSVELAELSARLRTLPLRYRDRVEVSEPSAGSTLDRLGGLALAAIVIWFFALQWVSQAQNPAWALALFFGMFVLSVGLLGRLRLAAVRYPLATLAPLAVVAGATAMT